MKTKIIGILVCTLLIATTIVIIPDNFKVEASGGGKGDNNGIGLDFDYMWWNITENISHVIYKAYSGK